MADVKKYYLQAVNFDKEWDGWILNAGRQTGTIKNGEIIVSDENDGFRLVCNREKPRDGAVYYWVMPFRAYCKSVNEQDEADRKSREYWDKKAEERLKVEFARKVEADEFHESLSLPFKYYMGYKEVLSGLSEGSNGCGTNKRSVIHLILNEDLPSGKRKKGDFLCRNSQAKSGANWSAQSDEALYHSIGRTLKYQPKVTCKACLRKIKKYNLKSINS